MLGLEDDKSKCMLFYCRFGYYRILVYIISSCEVCMIWRNPTEVIKIHCQIAESRTGKPSMVTQKIQLDCSTVNDTTPLSELLRAQPFRMWNRHIFICFCRSHKYFKDAKAMQKNKTWKWKLNLTWKIKFIQPPKQWRREAKCFASCGPN